MAELMRFSAFAVRQALVIAGGTKAEEVFDWLQEYSSDPHQALPRAVARASEQTWQAVELALLDSSGLRARLQVAFAPGVVKGLAAPLRQLVAERDPAFREGCRRELAQLQRSSATDLSWQQAAASFPHLQQPEELLKQARMVLAEEVAVMRTSGLEYLPELIALELPQQGGPLLLHLFNSFLRAEVMGSPELSQALSFSFLETLSEQQVQVLGLLDEILERLPKSPWGRAEMFRCPPRSAPRASSEAHCGFCSPRSSGFWPRGSSASIPVSAFIVSCHDNNARVASSTWATSSQFTTPITVCSRMGSSRYMYSSVLGVHNRSPGRDHPAPIVRGPQQRASAASCREVDELVLPGCRRLAH